MPPTGPQLVHAIKRNFGGLEESGVDPERMFFKLLPRNIHESPDMSSFHSDVNTCHTVDICMYIFYIGKRVCESRQLSTWTYQDKLKDKGDILAWV